MLYTKCALLGGSRISGLLHRHSCVQCTSYYSTSRCRLVRYLSRAEGWVSVASGLEAEPISIGSIFREHWK